MPTYSVHYEAEHHCQEAVTEALFELLVLPCQDVTQLISNVSITNSLQIDFFRVQTVFGYEAICFRINRPFQHCRFSLSCLVQKSEPSSFPVQVLSLEEEISIFRSDEFAIDHHLYLQFTALTGLMPEKVDTRFVYQENKPLLEFLMYLNEMIYQRSVATPSAKAIEPLAKLEDSFQDYSHLMLGLLRYNGIPCRYVSGYLQQGQDFVGSVHLHAWVEACIPNAGWVGFDPTRNRMIDEHYIKIADGLDSEDCKPMKSFFHTNNLNQDHTMIIAIEQQQQ